MNVGLVLIDLALFLFCCCSALVRCSREAFELSFEDGCSYVEARFCPALHCQRGLSMEEVIASVLEVRSVLLPSV